MLPCMVVGAMDGQLVFEQKMAKLHTISINIGLSRPAVLLKFLKKIYIKNSWVTVKGCPFLWSRVSTGQMLANSTCGKQAEQISGMAVVQIYNELVWLSNHGERCEVHWWVCRSKNFVTYCTLSLY